MRGLSVFLRSGHSHTRHSEQDPYTSLGILAKIIYIVLGLAKDDVEHKFTLCAIVEAISRKAQVYDLACIYEVDYLTTVYAVARKSIGMPADYAFRQFRRRVI
jgi:hypothetical protein